MAEWENERLREQLAVKQVKVLAQQANKSRPARPDAGRLKSVVSSVRYVFSRARSWPHCSSMTSRSFGSGATHQFDIFLVGDINPYTFLDLIPAARRSHSFPPDLAGDRRRGGALHP